VPAFAELLPVRGPRKTTLTYEDWSSLAWYQTGATVVGLLPAGFAKLAYDPAVFTEHGQSERRTDLLRAFDGDPADLAAVAGSYGASSIVLAQQDGRLGLFDAAAVPVAARPGALTGGAETVPGNGWDALTMLANAALELPLRATGPVHLEIRLAGAQAGVAAPLRRFQLVAVAVSGASRRIDVDVPATRIDLWQIVTADVDLNPGDHLVLQAIDPLTVQSVRGFMPIGGAIASGSQLVPGWEVSITTPEAVTLARIP
jgi:hypothetical protein